MNIFPATINLTLDNGLGIYQGANWEIPVTVIDRNNETGVETAVSLSDYTGTCDFKVSADSNRVIASPTVTIDGNTFTLTLTADETAEIPVTGQSYRDVTTYFYDVLLTKQNGDAYRALQGRVQVSPAITLDEE